MRIVAIVAEGVAARARSSEPARRGEHVCSGTWQGSTRSSSSVRRPRSAAISRAWNGRPPSCAPTGCSTSSPTRLDAAAGTVLDHGDAANDPGWAPDPDPRMKNHGASARLPPEVGGPRGRRARRRRGWGAAARPRRRLHQPRRCTGRDPAGTTGDPARAGLVRRARRLQHARHDPIGQRLGHAVRDGLRPWRSRPGRRRGRSDRGCGERRAVRRPGPRRGRVADARIESRRALRRGDAGGRRRTGRSRRLERVRRPPDRRLVPRIRPRRPRQRRAAGPSPRPSRMAWRSTRRSRPSGSSPRAAHRSSGSGRPR